MIHHGIQQQHIESPEKTGHEPISPTTRHKDSREVYNSKRLVFLKGSEKLYSSIELL
jgi:hypothetical protein